MLKKQPKPPTTQRTFAHPWGELDYLCRKARYWLYARNQKARAVRYLPRLQHILCELPDRRGAILREEGLALVCELKGKIAEALAHRRREITLMERLHQEAGASHYSDHTRAYMLRDRDRSALRQRRAILEILEKKHAAQNGTAASTTRPRNGHAP